MKKSVAKSVAPVTGKLIRLPLEFTPEALLEEIARHPVGVIIPIQSDRAEVDAKADASAAHRPPNARGVRYTTQVVHFLGVELVKLGFKEEKKDGQVRFLSPDGFFSVPLRFVCVRAPYNTRTGGFDIGSGRNCFETLCKSNDSQLSLFEESEEPAVTSEGIVTVWIIFTQHTEDMYSLNIAVGRQITRSGILHGTVRQLLNRVTVGSISGVAGGASVLPVPIAVPVPPQNFGLNITAVPIEQLEEKPVVDGVESEENQQQSGTS